MPQSGGQNSYDPEIAADICHLLSVSSSSLETICSSNKRFPTARTFYRWLLDREELRQLYAHAKDAQLQILADEIVPLADSDRICEKIEYDADGKVLKRIVLDQVERTKLQIDSRKWLLSKLAPKKYGDKIQQEVSGEIAVKRVVSDI